MRSGACGKRTYETRRYGINGLVADCAHSEQVPSHLKAR